MAEIQLKALSFEHLGRHVRQLDEPTSGPLRRNWVRVAGSIVSVRHFYDQPQKVAKGKPVGPAPTAHTSLIVEVGRDDRGAIHREILALSTQKVDINS